MLSTRLKSAGVLGLNKRNGCYVLPYNKRSLYPLVDNKLETKKLATQAGIAVPELYDLIEISHDIAGLHRRLANRSDFVVKPAHGSGGEGVLVVQSLAKGGYRLISGRFISNEALEHHIENILSGMYSLGGQSDVAMIEYRVKAHTIFSDVTYKGVPDVRIIVFVGVPVMAMVRLPTSLSDGKANLHQGAIGVGLDIASGETVCAVHGNDIVTEHPDTGVNVIGLKIPYWRELLNTAAGCFELTGLGYQGVDIVLDNEKGPMILELNARPGLNIQIANNAGLLPRLELIEKSIKRLTTREEKIRFARENFSTR